MNDVVRPARPHHKLTADGRRMREVLTYSRRGNRFTPRQAESWAAHHAVWVIPEEAVDRPGFALAEWFGREAPLIVGQKEFDEIEQILRGVLSEAWGVL